jgi:hypothetical protein
MNSIRGRIGHLEAYSLVCSPREFGEGQEDENGSIGRGELGRLHPWRSYDNLDPCLFMVISIAWRRAHMWRRVHH